MQEIPTNCMDLSDAWSNAKSALYTWQLNAIDIDDSRYPPSCVVVVVVSKGSSVASSDWIFNRKAGFHWVPGWLLKLCCLTSSSSLRDASQYTKVKTMLLTFRFFSEILLKAPLRVAPTLWRLWMWTWPLPKQRIRGLWTKDWYTLWEHSEPLRQNMKRYVCIYYTFMIL